MTITLKDYSKENNTSTYREKCKEIIKLIKLRGRIRRKFKVNINNELVAILYKPNIFKKPEEQLYFVDANYDAHMRCSDWYIKNHSKHKTFKQSIPECELEQIINFLNRDDFYTIIDTFEYKKGFEKP